MLESVMNQNLKSQNCTLRLASIKSGLLGVSVPSGMVNCRAYSPGQLTLDKIRAEYTRDARER